jgi:hypothetical protein
VDRFAVSFDLPGLYFVRLTHGGRSRVTRAIVGGGTTRRRCGLTAARPRRRAARG